MSALLLCLAGLLALPLPLHAQSFTAISTGGYHTLGLKIDGALWAWGRNTCGQLGDGSANDRLTPGLNADDFINVSAGYTHSLGLKADGSLWFWGLHEGGILDPFPLEAVDPVPRNIGEGFAAISAGGEFSLCLKMDGRMYACGHNSHGLGDGQTTISSDLALIGEGFAAISAGDYHSLGLKADGSLWAWGRNDYGQLGLGSTQDSATPVFVGNGFALAAAGWGHSLGLKSDGSLWAWGKNDYGQLGTGSGRWEAPVKDDDEYSASPVHIADGLTAIATGGQHSLGLKTDGSLWAWGWNSLGQFGDGTTATRRAPVQVGSGFVSIAAGGACSLALKYDGSSWAWGYNVFGQLGDGTATDRLSPVLIDAGDGEQYLYYVPYAPGAGDFALGFGVSNAGNVEPAGVVVDYFNNNGVYLDQDFATIPAGGHASFMRGPALDEGGWARVTASQPVDGMALAFGSGEDPMFDMDFKAELATNLAAAHVDTGANWISRAMLANPNGEPAALNITFHTDDGATQTADLAIPALGAVQYDLAEAFPGLAGAIEVESSQGLAGFILYDGRALGNYVGGLSMTPAE